MKFFKYISIALIAFTITGCEIQDEPNPNGSILEGFSDDPSDSELQALVTGTENLLRQEIGFYYDVVSIVGREYYFFTGSDPRYTGEVLGKGESVLDNAGFYGTRPYYGRFKTIKNLNVLKDAVAASTQITAQETEGYLGFAKTIQAYEYHLALNLQGSNGIRFDVADPANLGPFLEYDAALDAIADLLNDAATHLENAGDSFPFVLSTAMAGFDSPAGFLTFNKALAARIALYQGNKADALNNLTASFINMAGDLNVGPARFYSTAGGDFTNNIFRPLGQADAIIAHPSYTNDIENGDARINKVAMREDTLALDGLSGNYDVNVYKSLNYFVPYIRNEELILIAAEANIGADNAAAIAAIDVIRTAAGLATYSGGNSDAELVTELIKQRRYSLFGEGHRWVDMRRWGMLGDLPLDRAGDNVWDKFPRPVSE